MTRDQLDGSRVAGFRPTGKVVVGGRLEKLGWALMVIDDSWLRKRDINISRARLQVWVLAVWYAMTREDFRDLSAR